MTARLPTQPVLKDQRLPIAHTGSIALTGHPTYLVHEAKTGYMRL
jgi:hypothetical protein